MRQDFSNLDFTPVTGGADQAPYLRNDLDDLSALKTDSPIDLHIVRLLQLHPALKVRFRNQDLTRLNDDAKQQLLTDMTDVLGLQQLNLR